MKARRLAFAVMLALAACDSAGKSATPPDSAQGKRSMSESEVRIGYLHHSTGGIVWKGGVPEFFDAWNREHATSYRIERMTYPATTGGWPGLLGRFAPNKYPWANYPYDYWNLWVRHRGTQRDRSELNLDDLVQRYDVIVFKHCYPVSRVKPDDGKPSVSSEAKTLANYRLQYDALRSRLREFPSKKFIVWTGAALPEGATTPEDARRAREFFAWVRDAWDEPGDNIYVWDFNELETEGGLFLKPEYAAAAKDAHPTPEFGRKVAPLIGRRIVDVIEGRGDSAADVSGRAGEHPLRATEGS